MISQLVGRGALVLFALWSWVPFFSAASDGRPIPQYDFLSPSLALIGGLLLLLLGWVCIIQGVGLAWPDRVMASRQPGPDLDPTRRRNDESPPA